ncbi:MAG: hypothetical protein HZA36_00930 [Parcubacteria group bacterium]|nr:hypothetical protein [Parcubacteria group bacterium]
MRKIHRRFTTRHTNFDLVLSVVCLVLIWRGVWHLTDIFIFLEDTDKFYGYLVPMLIGFAYLYFNDFKLTELEHGGNELEDEEMK